MLTRSWRITLHFGRVEFSTIENAPSETSAITSAMRYAAALGYSGHPTRTQSRIVA